MLGRLNIAGLAGDGGEQWPEQDVSVNAFDCYRELANVAMGQAADLLARLLDVFVVLPVPNVNLFDPGELSMALSAATRSGSGAAVCQGYMSPGIAGEALLIFNDTSIPNLARLMKYRGELDESAKSELLLDTGNILIGACLKGIADQLDTRFSQGHPTVLGQHRDIDALVENSKARGSRTLAIEICYTIEDYDISCDLLLLFTEDSMTSLNEKMAPLINA
ncbi:hypothetical protein [Alkalilimnicola ehrlichii]|uniref:hypothetical protein n=1 Tax=Alkalilimnicola ehrlichii TaxID=351052 RepID=UPI0021618BED|nr:hypothetical protein [Alkalilimnicola ehrlichii]